MAEASGLLLAGAAAAAGEARDWWSRGRGEGPGLTERRLRGPGQMSARQPDGCGRGAPGPGLGLQPPRGVGLRWPVTRAENELLSWVARLSGRNPCVLRGLGDLRSLESPESVPAGRPPRAP